MIDTTPTSDARNSRRASYLWPGIVVALLAGHVILMVVVVLIATSDPTFSVEPDYYDKALHWDDTATQRAANQRLGWVAAVDVGSDIGIRGERTVSCRLTNSAGDPLDGAQIELVAFPHARGAERATQTLEPAGDGRYAAQMRFQRKGTWEFRLRVERGPDTFTYRETRDVYPPGEHR